MLSHFHLIPERNGQTDGRTDKIAISILRVSVLTLDNNVSQWAVVHYKQKYVAFLSIFCNIIYDKHEITDAWQCHAWVILCMSRNTVTRRPTSCRSLFVLHHVHSTRPLSLIVLSRLDRGIQSTTEMLPLKRRRQCCT